MRQITALCIVLAVFGWVFYLISVPPDQDPKLLEALERMSPLQKRRLALSRIPGRAQALEGKRELLVKEDFGKLEKGKQGPFVPWDKLSSFEWKPGAEIPEDVRALHGTYVILQGYIVPLDYESRTRNFAFVQSFYDTCFREKLKLNQVVYVTAPGGPVFAMESLMNIAGRLSVGEERIGGQPASLYRLELTAMSEAKPPEPLGSHLVKEKDGHEHEH